MSWVLLGSLLVASQAAHPPRPNIALIVVDDMRFDELAFLPFVASQAATAFQFHAAYVSDPLCCPTRASILSGGYFAKNHGVLTNERPNGGAWAFDDIHADTLATRLQAAGYATGLFGKYLNQYQAWASQQPGGQIPPGWSSFAGCGNQVDWSAVPLWIGASTPTARGIGTRIVSQQYAAYELRDRAAAFLDSAAPPWFLHFSALAPHLPATPDPADAGAYAEYAAGGAAVYRGRAWGEDVADKPAWVQARAADWWGGDPGYYSTQAPFLPNQITPDDLVADRRRSMLALDRTLEELWARFDANTVVILISDNGFFYGEHLLFDKGAPYEEAIRVPLLVWLPDVPGRDLSSMVYADVDVAATIMALARLPQFPSPDGRSLLRMMRDFAPGRPVIYSQSWSEPGGDVPGWAMVRDASRKYVSLDTGEIESYDLSTDPFETSNLGTPHADLAAVLAPLRGLSLRTDSLPDGTVGVPYSAALEAWGGAPPLSFALESGALPPGLSLSLDGLIDGTPTAAGLYSFRVRVTDSSASPKHGGPQAYRRDITLMVE